MSMLHFHDDCLTVSDLKERIRRVHRLRRLNRALPAPDRPPKPPPPISARPIPVHKIPPTDIRGHYLIDDVTCAAQSCGCNVTQEDAVSLWRPRIRDIQACVCEHFKVTFIDLVSERRTADIVRPRHVGIYLARILTTKSLPYIGQMFRRRDHTTVLHAVHRMERLIETDIHVAADIEAIRARLEGP